MNVKNVVSLVCAIFIVGASLNCQKKESFSITQNIGGTTMSHGIFRLKVENYSTWKSDWDKSSDFRKSGGQKGFHIFKMADDPHDIILLIEWDTIDNMKKFMESPELEKALKRSGVKEMVEKHYMELIEKGSV